MTSLVSQKGTSLIEVMLASVLGIFLTHGLVELHLSSKKTFAVQNALVHIQENARFASHILGNTIRMAGDFSCEGALLIDSRIGLEGYQSNPPASLKDKVLKATDSILIHRCNIKGGLESIDKKFFFVSATSRNNLFGDNVYALYESPLYGNKVELIPNVVNMRIQYGVMDPQNMEIKAYKRADDVLDWEMVKSVEIALLLRSEAPVFITPLPVTFMGDILPASRYLHKQWNLYISLRER
jgi:hypothetical protein